MVLKGKFLVNETRRTITKILSAIGFEESKNEEDEKTTSGTSIFDNEKYAVIVDDIGDIGSRLVNVYIVEK